MNREGLHRGPDQRARPLVRLRHLFPRPARLCQRPDRRRVRDARQSNTITGVKDEAEERQEADDDRKHDDYEGWKREG